MYCNRMIPIPKIGSPVFAVFGCTLSGTSLVFDTFLNSPGTSTFRVCARSWSPLKAARPVISINTIYFIHKCNTKGTLISSCGDILYNLRSRASRSIMHLNSSFASNLLEVFVRILCLAHASIASNFLTSGTSKFLEEKHWVQPRGWPRGRILYKSRRSLRKSGGS